MLLKQETERAREINEIFFPCRVIQEPYVLCPLLSLVRGQIVRLDVRFPRISLQWACFFRGSRQKPESPCLTHGDVYKSTENFKKSLLLIRFLSKTKSQKRRSYTTQFNSVHYLFLLRSVLILSSHPRLVSHVVSSPLRCKRCSHAHACYMSRSFTQGL